MSTLRVEEIALWEGQRASRLGGSECGGSRYGSRCRPDSIGGIRPVGRGAALEQPLRLRLLGGGRRGDRERHRQLVLGIHDQVQQVAEPGALLLAAALHARWHPGRGAVREVLLARSAGGGVQLLAVQRQHLAKAG